MPLVHLKMQCNRYVKNEGNPAVIMNIVEGRELSQRLNK